VCNISWYPPFVLQYNHDDRVTQTPPAVYVYLFSIVDFILYNLIGIELVKLTVHLLNGDMYPVPVQMRRKKRNIIEILMWKYSTLLTITKGKKKEKF
jgi:hypothetical protein